MTESKEWQELKEDKDYEININYPHQIRKKSNKRIVSEWIDKLNGYIRCKLNSKNYFKHRLIAIQWISNPDNLPQIDHINRNKTDNRIENLRWTNNSENQRNKTGNLNVVYEYFDKIDEEAIEITDYGKYQFEFYYYVEKEDAFYFYNGVQYRKLHINIDKRNENAYIFVYDTSNHKRFIYLNKFKKLYGIDF